MEPPAKSPWKRRFLFFFAGAVLASVCAFIEFRGMYPGPGVQADEWRRWREIVGRLPWVAFLLILVLRVVKGRRICAGAYFLGTVTPTALLFGWLLLGSSVGELVHRQEFNAETWRDQERLEHDGSWPPRLCMVDNLMSSGRLDGLTEDQVVELLGPPHDKSFPGGARSCDIHYHLGPERGFIRLDSEWLFITFGVDGKVNRYWLYTD